MAGRQVVCPAGLLLLGGRKGKRDPVNPKQAEDALRDHPHPLASQKPEPRAAAGSCPAWGPPRLAALPRDGGTPQAGLPPPAAPRAPRAGREAELRAHQGLPQPAPGAARRAGGSHLPAAPGTLPAPRASPLRSCGAGRAGGAGVPSHTPGGVREQGGGKAPLTLCSRLLLCAAILQQRPPPSPPPFSSPAPAGPPPSGGGRALRGGRYARVSRQGEVVGQAVVELCHPTQ